MDDLGQLLRAGRVETIHLVLVDEAFTRCGHLHECHGEQIPEVAILLGWEVGPPGDEGEEEETAVPQFVGAAGEEEREVCVELCPVHVQHRGWAVLRHVNPALVTNPGIIAGALERKWRLEEETM